MEEITSLQDFAEKYPDEYNAYVDDMAAMYDETLDYPEDWETVNADG